MLSRVTTASVFVGSLFVASGALADGYDRGPAIARVLPYNWSGFYVGANAGGAWGDSHVDFFNVTPTPTHVAPDLRGGLLGVQAGADYQMGRVVLGAEISWDGANLKGDKTCPDATFTCKNSVRDLFLATARVGYAFERVLPYIKGGYASADVRSTTVPTFPGFNDSERLQGWALGGGIEYAVHSHVTLGVEYMHVDLGSERFSPGTLPGVVRDVDARFDSVTARLNFKFGGRDDYLPIK